MGDAESRRTDPLVDTRWSAEASCIAHLVLPDGCLDVVDRGGKIVVVGPMGRARWVRVIDAQTRGIRLRPGAASWLGVPLCELRDQVVPLSDLPVDSSVWQSKPGDPLLLLARHGRVNLRRDPRVIRVSEGLLRSPGIPLHEFAAEVGWTPRHLRRRFQTEIGLSPRRFARIARLRALAPDLAGEQALATLAFMHGYADQAHLCRDVKSLTGLSPTVLRGVLQSGSEVNAVPTKHVEWL